MASAMSKNVMGEFLTALHRHDELVSLAALTRTRTLVLAGANDKILPRAHAELLVRQHPGADLILVDRCGHMIPLERPEVVNPLLTELITAILVDLNPDLASELR